MARVLALAPAATASATGNKAASCANTQDVLGAVALDLEQTGQFDGVFNGQLRTRADGEVGRVHRVAHQHHRAVAVDLEPAVWPPPIQTIRMVLGLLLRCQSRQVRVICQSSWRFARELRQAVGDT